MTGTPDLTRLEARHWSLVAASVVAAYLVGRPGVGGIVLGGGVIGLSLVVYSVALRTLLRGSRPQLAIGLLFVKLAAFLGVGWLALTSGGYRPDPIGFALGITCFPVAAVWEAVRVRGRS